MLRIPLHQNIRSLTTQQAEVKADTLHAKKTRHESSKPGNNQIPFCNNWEFCCFTIIIGEPSVGSIIFQRMQIVEFSALDLNNANLF